ncbi:MAG: LPS assembly lipoprotein LptE [Desulfovibrio sp.]|nr:LPS assembly lipoprotein LptE [Desulfovibrio sp.]
MSFPKRKCFRKAAPRRTAALLLCCLLTAALCAGCGYTLATDSPSVLGDGNKTLKVKGVDFPTLHPWLPNTLRSILRDEIGARRLARWVDSGPADFTIQINVLSFTNREWISSELDTTQLFASSITLEAVVYSGAENREVWRSGKISYSEYEAQVDEKALSGSILKQIIRRLCDEMRNTF